MDRLNSKKCLNSEKYKKAELGKIRKNRIFWGKFRMSSGVLRVARGGSGAKAPPLAARPTFWQSGSLCFRNSVLGKD